MFLHRLRLSHRARAGRPGILPSVLYTFPTHISVDQRKDPPICFRAGVSQVRWTGCLTTWQLIEPGQADGCRDGLDGYGKLLRVLYLMCTNLQHACYSFHGFVISLSVHYFQHIFAHLDLLMLHSIIAHLKGPSFRFGAAVTFGLVKERTEGYIVQRWETWSSAMSSCKFTRKTWSQQAASVVTEFENLLNCLEVGKHIRAEWGIGA